MAGMNFNVCKDICRSVKWHTHFSVGRRWIEGKDEGIFVDMLPSGKSVFYYILFVFILLVVFVACILRWHEDCIEYWTV